MTAEQLWVCLGLTGQLLFTGRFLIQWLSSERHGRSVIPVAFWYLSLGGAATLLAYALYRRDPVFVIGQSTGLVIYGRNLQLIYRERSKRRDEKIMEQPEHSATGGNCAADSETTATCPAILPLCGIGHPPESSEAADDSRHRRTA